MTTNVLRVPDISCMHCARSITEALAPLEGVRRVQVDVPARRVTVEYDERLIGLVRMEAVLREEEYPVAAVEPA